MKFGKKVFKDLYILHFLAINVLKMCSKYVVYKWRVGDKPTEFGKIVEKILKNICENNYTRYAGTIIYLSVGE